MDCILRGIDPTPSRRLFGLDDAQLLRRRARRGAVNRLGVELRVGEGPQAGPWWGSASITHESQRARSAGYCAATGTPTGQPTQPRTRGPDPMYTATFTFAKGTYDEEFHRRDQAIADIAKAIPGYLGEEAWENPATGLISNVYYWRTLEALQQLIDHPLHRAAKNLQDRWLQGYHITIAQVLRSHGDGGIAHPLVAAAPAADPPADAA